MSTWSGWVWVAFVIDAYTQRVLGRRSATTMTLDLVLDAIEDAIRTRRCGDAFDNVLAETIDGLYKTELIQAPRPLGKPRAVKVATLEWAAWFNRRLNEHTGDIPPVEPEQVCCVQNSVQQLAARPNQ